MDQEKKGKRPNGRKTLKENKRKKYDYYLNDTEYKQLLKRVKESNHKRVGAFVRSLIIQENQHARHINPATFLKDVGQLNMEINKVGVNINQLAKHINQMALLDVTHPEMAKAIEERIALYVTQQEKIISKLNEVLLS